MVQAYYERPELWTRGIYTAGYERDRLRAAVEFLPQDVTSLVDVGCGNGAFLSFLEEMRPKVKAMGVEPSQAAVRQKWCSSRILNGQITSLPFRDHSFDVVSSMAVLEHIPTHELARGIAELTRVARKYVLIDLPFRERRTRIRCPECGCGFDPHLHLRSYDLSDIHSLFPHFLPVRQRVLRGHESVIPFVLLRVLRREIGAERFPNAVCPQCGHRTPSTKLGNGEASQRSLWRRLWERQPSLAVDREIFVLFERQQAGRES